MSAEEQARAAELLPIVSDCLRAEAEKTGRNLDKMIMKKPHLASVAKSVTVDVTARILQTFPRMKFYRLKASLTAQTSRFPQSVHLSER
jgi:hypothetical protein